MRKKKAKKVAKKSTRPAWDSLVVASVDSLPKGVFLLFVTTANSPTAVAQRKSSTIGIPGDVTVVQEHPLNKSTGKALFAELLSSLRQFPYGDSDCLVKASALTIRRKYAKLSSEDPNQIELRKRLYERDVNDQLRFLSASKAEVKRLNAISEKLESRITELNMQKNGLVSEIKDLEKERESLLADAKKLRRKVIGLDSVYKSLKEFPLEDDAHAHWERIVLIKRLSEKMDALIP